MSISDVIDELPFALEPKRYIFASLSLQYEIRKSFSSSMEEIFLSFNIP